MSLHFTSTVALQFIFSKAISGWKRVHVQVPRSECWWQYLHKNSLTRWWFPRSYFHNYLGCWSNPASFFICFEPILAIQCDHFMVLFHIIIGRIKFVHFRVVSFIFVVYQYFLEITTLHESGFCFPSACWKKHKRQTFESSPLVFARSRWRISRPWANLFEDVRHIRKWPRCLLCAWAEKHEQHILSKVTPVKTTSAAWVEGDFFLVEVFGEIWITQTRVNLPLKHAALSKITWEIGMDLREMMYCNN